MCMVVAAVMHKSLSVVAPNFSPVLQCLSCISDAVDVVVPDCKTQHIPEHSGLEGDHRPGRAMLLVVQSTTGQQHLAGCIEMASGS